MIHGDESPLRGSLAANLRRLRIARHLSLSELARATAISKATLSGIESGRANPTIETLAALADALRVSFAELLEEAPLGEMRVLRASRPASAADGVSQRVLETLTPAAAGTGPALAPGAGLQLTELTLPARHLHEPSTLGRGARVQLYVVAGRVIAGPVERSTELAPGDYASFPGDVAHLYETLAEPARLLLLTLGAG
jgi:transcriptional regulator with XRE-family HTH domain